MSSTAPMHFHADKGAHAFLRPGETAQHLALRMRVLALTPQLSTLPWLLQKMRLSESKSTMSLTAFERAYGHLFLCYREGLDWYYEAVTVLRRVLAGSLSVLLAAQPYERRSALFACTVLFLVLHAMARPFFRKADNMSGIVVLSAVCCIAGLELSNGDSASNQGGDNEAFRNGSRAAQLAMVILAASWVLLGQWLGDWVRGCGGTEASRSTRSSGDGKEWPGSGEEVLPSAHSSGNRMTRGNTTVSHAGS